MMIITEDNIPEKMRGMRRLYSPLSPEVKRNPPRRKVVTRMETWAAIFIKFVPYLFSRRPVLLLDMTLSSPLVP